jgi:hypothetical protein
MSQGVRIKHDTSCLAIYLAVSIVVIYSRKCENVQFNPFYVDSRTDTGQET